MKDLKVIALKKLNRDHKRFAAAEKHFSGASRNLKRKLKDAVKAYDGVE